MAKKIKDSGFKLLAIRPLKGCDSRFRKNLKEGVVYKFYQDYKYLNETEEEISITNDNLIAPIIKVQVPKNDIDLYSKNDLKINVSALVGKNGSGKSTLIEMLFLANYIIAIKNEVLEPNLSKTLKEIEEIENLPKNEDEMVNRELKRLTEQKNNFQNIYSQFKVEIYYSIDENVFCLQIKDNKIEQKFIEGDEETKRDYTIKKILQDETFDFKEFFYSIAINYSLYGLNASFMGDWIEALFHKNDAYQTPIVINPYRENGNINVNKELYLSKQRLISNLLKPIQNKEDNHRIITETQQVKVVLYSLNEKKIDFAYSKWIGGEKIEYSFEELSFGFHYDSYGKILTTETKDNFIFKVLKAFLGDSYDLEEGKLINHNIEIEKYIIKKLIQIARTYSKYNEFFSDNKKTFDLPMPGDTRSDKVQFSPHSFYQIEEYLKLLVDDNSHITFELRQAINYLKVAPFQSYELEKVELPDKTIDAYRISISDLSNAIIPIAITQQNIIRFIPPSLFDIELELNSIKEDESPTYYSMLSSGEQQLIQSVESILYHINNLESVHLDVSNTNENKKVYEIVNIVLDEIELYFHPEFQRKFISHLIKRLSELGTDKIKVFNILFATHSPFILSDIPSSNILRLKDGEPESDLNQTFGANIHDLLANDFFLDNGFMGGFANDFIKKIIIEIKESKNLSKEEAQKLHNKIEVIGEIFIKQKLTEMVIEKTSITEVERIQSIIDFKETEIQNLKNDQKKINNHDKDRE